MKFATVSKSLMLSLALVLTTAAFASPAAANKGSLQLQNPTSINGTTVKPGDYKLEWDGSGPNVEVSIMQGKNVVAKVPAHVVDLGSPSASNAAVTTKNGDGSSTLASIRLQGKKFALQVGDANMQSGASQ